MAQNLGEMTAAEIRENIGKFVLANEMMHGTILVARLVDVKTNDDGKPRSIVVNEGKEHTNVIWPTQWRRAVFV